MTDAKICCFTGHRSIDYSDLLRLDGLLARTITKLAMSGVKIYRAGGAIGFDTLAALKVIELRESLGLELELILPCRNQSEKWCPRDRKYYDYILSRADRHRYISDVYTRDCMLERDRRLVDGSDFCVAFCKKSTGGTAYTLCYAIKSGLEIINLADEISAGHEGTGDALTFRT